jgi:hypothetical protein
MRIHSRERNIWGRRFIVLLLLCGLLFPMMPQINAASVIYEYKWITNSSELPTDDQWHDYFIAWEDLDDKNTVWFTDYHWYTADGYNNFDAGGTHWMEYKAASTLPDSKASSFTSTDCLGHMQIRYAGIDEDNGNSPMYYIRVSKMHGGYSYFTRYEPTNNEKSADAFTFQDKGDVFHIFVNIGGKADRYLTRDGQYLETTESSSYGGGEHYRPLRVYQRSFTIDQTDDGNGDVIGKVTLHEYHWVNTVDKLMALANSDGWADILLAWEDADGYGTTNPDKVWYTKEVWYEEGEPNYKNGSFWEGTANEFFYWSNDTLGSDGYGSAYAESFILPSKAGHFQVKLVDWDDDNPVDGYTNAEGKKQKSPVFNIRFDIGRGRHVYIGNNGFYDDAEDAEDYTVQLRLGRKDAEDLYGSVWIINNMFGEDEMITRKNNRFDVSNWGSSGYWEFPFRIYTYRPVEYDAIVKSFTIGKGATYSIDRQLIVDKGVTITVEDGGVLTVDDHLLNNGNIVVKNGGTVIVNDGGYIMAYDRNAEGKITLDGGNLIIMDGAKVICDGNGGELHATHGAAIVNRGLLLVGKTLGLNHNSYLKNDANAMLVVGGRLARERGGVGAFAFEEVVSRVENGKFTYLISNKAKIINKGRINEPGVSYITYSENAKANTSHRDGGNTVPR